MQLITNHHKLKHKGKPPNINAVYLFKKVQKQQINTYKLRANASSRIELRRGNDFLRQTGGGPGESGLRSVAVVVELHGDWVGRSCLKGVGS
jgi:hypothetical protein